MINILIIGLAIYFIVRHIKKKEENQKAANSIPNQDAKDCITNLDNNYFLIKDGRLLEYRGQSDTIVVPKGVGIIGGNDTKICNKTIRNIYIPNTVHVISDCALPYVENMYYAGAQEALHYDKQYNFYTNGWVPDWAKPERIPITVNNVNFHYNDSHYDETAKLHYERIPDELQPQNG